MQRLKYCIIVAPYSPIGSQENISLGASKKIESVTRILSLWCQRIIFVNSAHNPTHLESTKVNRAVIGGVSVVEVTPFTFFFRPLGKLSNLFVANIIGKQLGHRRCKVLWIYNGYSFECRLALAFAKINDAPIVLELEDWPTARNRGLKNIKCWIDLGYMKKILPHIRLVTCVNEVLLKKMLSRGLHAFLCPSLLNPLLTSALVSKAPFSSQPYVLGYFGGLSREKGANVLLEIIDCLPTDWRIHVTGSGPLAQEFRRAAGANSARISFIENATDEEVYRAMMQCDVIVNPHKSIASMNDGIFPFKVLEAIATGRVLLTTPLPSCGMSLSGAVINFDGSAKSLLKSLQLTTSFYHHSKDAIDQLACDVIAAYSEGVVGQKLDNLLKCDEQISISAVGSGKI